MGYKAIEADIQWSILPKVRSVRFCCECEHKIEGNAIQVTIFHERLSSLSVGRFCQSCFDFAFGDSPDVEEPVDTESSGTKGKTHANE